MAGTEEAWGDEVCDDEVQSSGQELDDIETVNFILRAVTRHWRIFK